MTRFAKLIPAILLLTAAPACAQRRVESPAATPRTPDEERLIADFKQRVDRYEDVSGKLEREVYPESSELDPNTIHARQKELASRIIKALPTWKQGDIFTPEIAALFKRRIAEIVNGPDGANIKGAIFDDAPGDRPITVFAEYPAGVPIATLPAQMLKVFPVVPKELEYRFLGPNLILMDIAAFLIVDVIPDAIK
ncbi:MAG: hypothetical protein WD690_13860 [Vicinamibacterales bacterium]